MKTVMEQDNDWYRLEMEALHQELFDLRHQNSELIELLDDQAEDLELAQDGLVGAMEKLEYEQANRKQLGMEENNKLALYSLKLVDLVNEYDKTNGSISTILRLRKECNIDN